MNCPPDVSSNSPAAESAVTTAGAHPFSTGPDQCLVHNGSLSNHNGLRRELVHAGMSFETQNDTEVARFRVVRAKDPTSIEKVGGNILRTSGAVTRVDDGSTLVEQRMLEQSVADPINSMVELMRQARMLEANVRMMQYQDNLTGQAIAGITRNA